MLDLDDIMPMVRVTCLNFIGLGAVIAIEYTDGWCDQLGVILRGATASVVQ